MRSDLSALVVPLGELSRQQAVRYGPRTLFVCGGTRRTYAEFDERSTRLAGGLQGRGVRKGDRVACYMPNSIELIEAYYATSKAGAVTVFLNALLTAREIRYILQDSEAKVIVTASSLLPNVQEIRADAKRLETVVVHGKAVPPETVGLMTASPYRQCHPNARSRFTCFSTSIQYGTGTSGPNIVRYRLSAFQAITAGGFQTGTGALSMNLRKPGRS